MQVHLCQSLAWDQTWIKFAVVGLGPTHCEHQPFEYTYMYIFYTVYIHVLRNGIQKFIQCIFHTLSVPTAGHWWILDMTAAEIHGVKPLDVFIMFHHLTPKYIICFHWMFSSYHVSPCFYHLTPSKKKHVSLEWPQVATTCGCTRWEPKLRCLWLWDTPAKQNKWRAQVQILEWVLLQV